MAGFGVLSLLVRSGAHTGSATTTPTPASSSDGGALAISSRISEEAASGTSFFGSGSVSPDQSSSPPQASTHTS